MPTAGPAPTPSEGPEGGGSFVIQEHHARRLHWDFRLERNGVLVSWAIPKALPTDPKVNRLAVRTEDHPLEYAGFEGEIPKGEYGAGKVTIWDTGHYQTEKWSDREVKVVLHGQRAKGRFVLFQTKGDQWMIHRMDPPDPDWQPMPELIRPMLAVPGQLPKVGGWAFEFKWDGIRAIFYVDGGRIRIVSRNDKDVTDQYPELRGIGDQLSSHQVVLDGEIVAFNEAGRPSFSALQRRLGAGLQKARRLTSLVPITFMAFDVLHLDGRSTLNLAYEKRRELLESLGLAGEHWLTPPSYVDAGEDVAKAAREQHLEGVVAKKLDSPYLPGKRSPCWLKVKNMATQEVVIGGWKPGSGRRAGTVGALLLGIPGPNGLQYVGKVGTGFTDAALDDMARILAPLERPLSPFSPELPPADRKDAVWVEPKLVGEVAFSEWTPDSRLRQPSWRGLRPDKSPAEVIRES